jgi:hypothetical protein
MCDNAALSIRLAVCLALSLAAGCSGAPAPVAVTTYEETSIGQRALDEYDKNKDGKLDATELADCPGLHRSLPDVDRNKDGSLDAGEITERIKEYQAGNVGQTTVVCQVLRGEAPLAGATVTFVPEKFMRDSLVPGSAVVTPDGVAQPAMEGFAVPGLRCGFYRVEVSLKNAAGVETLPARFNSDTVLGQEIAPAQRGNIIFRLN